MSGTGKTTVVRALRSRGVQAIDMDEPGWSFHDERGHQRWQVERLARVLEGGSGDAIVVSGCSEDQATLRPLFTHVVLLSAPAEVIEGRIARRTDNPYGKDPAELAQVMADLRDVEPRLRAGASLEIVTTVPVETIVERLRAHCGLVW
jgi:shikimate kinase